MIKRALITGIDHYPDAPLRGCVNDASTVSRLLSRNEDHSLNFACRLMISSESNVTRAHLWRAIEDLLMQPADVALFYFSGHGTVNLQSGYLATQDASHYNEGILMEQFLGLVNSSPVKEVVVFLDCCFSGKFGNAMLTANDASVLREGISIVTASLPNQLSREVSGHGVFSQIVINALQGEAADLLGNVTVTRVFDHLDSLLNAWEQRPMLKAHLSRRLVLRQCLPKIPLATLQNLSAYFPEPESKLDLTPAYERTSESANPRLVGHFKDLVKFRAHGLVEPVEEEDLYWAAMNSKSCRLTPLGSFYHRLVKNNKI